MPYRAISLSGLRPSLSPISGMKVVMSRLIGQFWLSRLARSSAACLICSRRSTSSERFGSSARNAIEMASDWVLPSISLATCSSRWVGTLTLMLVVISLPAPSLRFLGTYTPTITEFVLAGNNILLFVSIFKPNRKFTQIYLQKYCHCGLLVITARTARTYE